jgi:SMC interacting uncharacterized protein involved in chromosome segregation
MIEEKDGEWCLYSKTKGKGGKRKSLGCYGSRAGAEKREKQVNMFKHMKKEASNMTSIQTIIAEEVEIILKEKSKRFRGIKEMKIKKSELYKIIQEELEVVLTNEEAEEMFDLDMTALLDEMMEEGLPFMKDVERARRGEIPPKQAAKIKAASDAMKTRAGDPSRMSQGGDEEVEEMNEEEEELDEKEDKWIQGADLKKGRCTPMGTPECPEGSPQYNLAKRFKSGDIHKANLKKGKNPHGPG